MIICVITWYYATLHFMQFLVTPKRKEVRFIKMQRIPKGFYPRKQYRRRSEESKNHYKKWGQRKLLLTEIRFLCEYIDKYGDSKPLICVYPGAGPGNHIPLLADMFPSVSFELWVCSICYIEYVNHRFFLRKYNQYLHCMRDMY